MRLFEDGVRYRPGTTEITHSTVHNEIYFWLKCFVRMCMVDSQVLINAIMRTQPDGHAGIAGFRSCFILRISKDDWCFVLHRLM